MSQQNWKAKIALFRLRALLRGDLNQFRHVWFRLVARLSRIDLETADLEQLGLSPEHSMHYVDSAGPDLDVVLGALPITRDDAILDLGCGKGGTLVTMARHPFGQIDGVEICQPLVDVAMRNLRQNRRGKLISVFQGDAARFSDLDRYTYFYMFHPFHAEVVDAVL